MITGTHLRVRARYVSGRVNMMLCRKKNLEIEIKDATFTLKLKMILET